MNKVAVSWERYLQDFMTERLKNQTDASHDILHILRVIENVNNIIVHPEYPILEPVDREVLMAAAYLHDMDLTPKDSPFRDKSSRIAAKMAADILETLPEYVEPFPKEKISQVVEAIRMHSFSYEQTILKLDPNYKLSLEAQILQDADRLDALGAAGIARMFYVSGKMGVPHFHVYRPNTRRESPLNDKRYVADHLTLKLNKLPGLMKTQAGKVMGEIRLKRLESFLNDLESHIHS